MYRVSQEHPVTSDVIGQVNGSSDVSGIDWHLESAIWDRRSNLQNITFRTAYINIGAFMLTTSKANLKL